MKKDIHYLNSAKFNLLDSRDFNFILSLMQIGNVHFNDDKIIFTLSESEDFEGNPDALMKALEMPNWWEIINRPTKSTQIVLMCAKIRPDDILNNPIFFERKDLNYFTLEGE